MKYISTRGEALALGFDDVLLSGLASDGGLYLPAEWPSLDRAALHALAGADYAEVAYRVMAPFVDGIAENRFRGMLAEAYRGFVHREIAPMRQLAPGLWLMELFHGPTLAFKDVALQLLAHLFDEVLSRRGQRVTIVGATSGDTGAAAIEAFRGRAAAEIVILHPRGRISEVQRRQMTTVGDANVHNVAIEGTFDDCQGLLKAMFNDAGFRDEVRLSAVNSINWARVMAQAVYYIYGALQLGAPDRAVSFVVPTGNFGDVYAGYAAARMGLPVGRLIVATNANDILHRFFTSGEYRLQDVVQTQSPSMDIQVASNFERLLFDLCDQNGAEVAGLMDELDTHGRFRLARNSVAALSPPFTSASIDEAATTATIRGVYQEAGILIDPHTAVGVAAASAADTSVRPLIVLATAHPAKFPEAVAKAVGHQPDLPPRLADLYDREERYTVLPNDLAAVEAHVRACLMAPAG